MSPVLSFSNFTKYLASSFCIVKVNKTVHKKHIFGFWFLSCVCVCSSRVFVTSPDVFLSHGKPRGKTKIWKALGKVDSSQWFDAWVSSTNEIMNLMV